MVQQNLDEQQQFAPMRPGTSVIFAFLKRSISFPEL